MTFAGNAGAYRMGASCAELNTQARNVQITNTTKALLIAALNAVEQLVVAFGVNLSDAQQAAIGGFLNAALAVAVALTYKSSPKRIPDA